MDVDDATTPSKASGSKAEGEVLTLDDSSDAEMGEVKETKGKTGKGKEKDAGKGTKRKSEGTFVRFEGCLGVEMRCRACFATLDPHLRQLRVELTRLALHRSLLLCSLRQEVETLDVQVRKGVVLNVEEGRRRRQEARRAQGQQVRREAEADRRPEHGEFPAWYVRARPS